MQLQETASPHQAHTGQCVTRVLTGYVVLCHFSGSPVNVQVTLERDDEITGPVIAPYYPQVTGSVLFFLLQSIVCLQSIEYVQTFI